MTETDDIRDCGDSRPLIAAFATAAVKQRVRELGNVVNRLMLDVLWPESWEAQENAYEALIGCCQKAAGKLFYRSGAADTDPANQFTANAQDKFRADITWNTAQFIETALDRFIFKHRKLTRPEIAALALRKHLGYVAGAVRNRLIDHLRHVYSKSRRADKATAQRIDMLADAAILRATVIGMSKRLSVELGGAFETLRILAEHYPFGKTKRQRKGGSTRIVAKTLHISEQQARTRKRQLTQAAKTSGIGFVRELVETILA